MNEYKYKDLYLGQEESFCFRVTEEKMRLFLSLTGDINPLHTDDAFAKSKGFESRVVYGMLTASLISTFGGVYFPGKFCLIQQVESKFLSPVFVGDELSVCGTVVELNEAVQQAVMKIEIKNQLGKKVMRGKLFVGFLE